MAYCLSPVHSVEDVGDIFGFCASVFCPEIQNISWKCGQRALCSIDRICHDVQSQVLGSHHSYISSIPQNACASSNQATWATIRFREADFALLILDGKVKVTLLFQKSLCLFSAAKCQLQVFTNSPTPAVY